MSLLGPVFYTWIAKKTSTARFFDGMVITALICLVSLHVLPSSLSHSAIITMAAISLGLLGPVLLSKLSNRSECEIQKPLLLFSTLGFIAHNMLDGAALVIHPLASNSTHLLALAVALHRFVESIAIFKTVKKSFGVTISSLIVLSLSLAMAFGYFFGEQIFLTMDESILHILQALACGMIFHVVLHPHHLKEIIPRPKGQNTFLSNIQSIGACCGIVLAILAYLLGPSHSH